MQIEPFELERWQSVWENKVELNISESGVHPLTTAELVPDPEQLRKILDVQQLYPQTNGSEELRSRIAELYPGLRRGKCAGDLRRVGGELRFDLVAN